MNKLWVDDERPAPDDSWQVAKNYTQAIEALSETTFDLVSLDYVLIGWESGFDVALWMEKHNRWPAALRIHTSSHLGRAQIIEFVIESGQEEILDNE